MARDYIVRSEKIQKYLSQIKDENIKERFRIFCSLHEEIYFKYHNSDYNNVAELRPAAEALCKLLVFLYVPNAYRLFDEKDKLIYKYIKVLDKGLDYQKIKETPMNQEPKYKYYEDKTDLGQLGFVLLCKTKQLENWKNLIYNKIKECYSSLYSNLSTDSMHTMPKEKQSCFSIPTLISFYFGWVRAIIDICIDKLSPLKKLLLFENDSMPEDMNEMELDKLNSEDSALQELDCLEGNFKHKEGKKYILLVSNNLKEEIKLSLAKIGWNMVIDFDPYTQKEKGLFFTINKIWEGIRPMVYSDIETNGDIITYWVEANGNALSKTTFSENNPKEWRRAYLRDIEDKINKLNIQLPVGEIILIDLYTNSKLPLAIYKSNNLPSNTIIYRFLSSQEEFIDENTKNDDINAVVKEYVVDQIKLARHFNLINNVISNTSNIPSINAIDVNTLTSYGIECVPVIPQSCEKKGIYNSFCFGNRITWQELYEDVDVKRDGYTNFYNKIANKVKRRKKFFGHIVHRPCSGGTTTALRLAYDLMNKNTDIAGKCYVVFLSELKSTINAICKKLKEFIEDKLPDTMLILVIDRTISDENVKILEEKFVVSTYLVSIVRVTYDQANNTDVLLYVHESVMMNEKPDFVRLYRNSCSEINLQELTDVIEFPLSTQYFKNTRSVDSYVQVWMEKLDNKYKEAIKHFSLLISIPSLYLHDYDRYVTTDFTNPVFEKLGGSIWVVLTSMNEESRDAFKKLFELELNSDNNFTKRIRPRFSLFARSIIKNSNMGVYDIAKEYIKYISNWNFYDQKKYIHDVFTKTPDFEDEDKDKKLSLSDKVSNFFKDNNSDPETILAVYKFLIESFPNDSYCLLSYSQYLYNKAYYNDIEIHNGKPFIESENILLDLLEKENDNLFRSLIYQSLGVVYFRRIGVIRILWDLTPDLYNYVLDYSTICSENCDKSIELDPLSAYGLVTKAQMLKTVLKITKTYKKYTDWNFCEIQPYLNMYMDFSDCCTKIEKHCPCEDSSIINSSLKIIKLFNELDDFKKKLNGNGNTKDLFRKYSKKLEFVKDDKLRIMYGCRLYDTVISSRRISIREDISKLNDKILSEIEKVTLYNARKGVSGAYEKLLKLYIFNSRTDRTIYDAIELLKEWESSTKSNEEHLWINYYFTVFYAIQILNEGINANAGIKKLYIEASKKTKEYCKSTNQKYYDTYAYLFYRESDDLQNITESKDLASIVKGTIIDVYGTNRRSGRALLDCGLEATFSAKDSKYNDTDINVTRLEGVIGFRFDGLGFYKQNIIDENEEDASNEYEVDEQLSKNDSNVKIMGRLLNIEKLYDKRPVFKKNNYDDEKNATQNIHGTINSFRTNVYWIARKQSIKIDRDNGFALGYTIREYDYRNNEDIIFDVKNIQKLKDGEPFYVACNIRPVEED